MLTYLYTYVRHYVQFPACTYPNFLPESVRKIILGEVVVEGGIGF